MKKSDLFKFGIGLTLGCVLAALVAFNVLLVWVATGPRSLDKFTPYLEQAFSATDESYHVKIKETWLVWDGWKHPMDIRVRGVLVLTKEGKVFSSFPEVSLGLDVVWLPLGKIYPTSISIQKPIISLLQTADKQLAFGLGDNTEGAPSAPLSALIEPLVNPASKSSLRKLRSIEIIEANVSVGSADKGVFFTAPSTNFIMRKEFGGALSLITNTTILYDKFQTPIRGRFELNRKTRKFEGILDFSQLQPAILASLFSDDANLASFDLPLSGRAGVAFDEKGALKTLGFKIDGGKGEIISPELGGALPVRKLQLVGRAENYLKSITMEQATIDFDGMMMNARGRVDVLEGDAAVVADASITNVPADMVKAFWPLKLAPMTREWVVSNITDGGISKASVRLNIAHGDLKKPALPKEAVDATVELKDAKIRYLPDHPQVRNVAALIKVDGLSLDAHIQSASAFENTLLMNGKLYIADLNLDNPPITLSMDADAAAKDIVTLLGLPRLEHAEHLNLSPAKASGRAKGHADLGFYFFEKDEQGNPTDITYDIKADVEGVSHAGFMKKFDLENVSGKFSVNNKDLHFIGGGAVNGANVSTGDVRYLFEPENGLDTFVKATATATLASLKRFGYMLPEVLEGALALDIDAKIGEAREEVFANIDLTQATINAADISWKKPATEAATIRFNSSKKDGITSLNDLTLTGSLSAKGSAVVGAGGGLENIALTNVSFGKTTLSQFEYGNIAGGTKFIAVGSSLDASGYLEEDSDEDFTFSKFPALELKLDVATMHMAYGQTMSAVKGSITCSATRCSQAGIKGNVADKPFDFSITPSGKNRKISVSAQNAGAFLKALGISQAMLEGALLLNGQYDDVGGGGLRGELLIRDYTLKDAPVLAKLLSLASLTGFFDTLAGKGISFKKLAAPFTLQGDTFTFKDAKTYGPAIGLSADGTITLPKTVLALEGTIVPSYTLNTVVGKVPLLGDILMGGDGEGVFAARYTIKGEYEDPEVMVNPLSILTPGFLRNMFDAL